MKLMKLLPNGIYQILYSKYKTHIINTKYYRRCLTHPEEELANSNCTIIWMSDNKVKQGGLCDRLWGAVSTYSICRSLNYDFKLLFTCPFLLTKYLVPNQYNWQIAKDDIINNSKISNAIFWPNVSSAKDTYYLEKSIRKHAKHYKQIHIYSNLKSTINFTLIFNHLFRPSEYLGENLGHIYSTMPFKRYISISFRFIGLLGDFQDIQQKGLSSDEQLKYMEICKNGIRNLSVPEDCGILVTSDSQRFQEYIRDIPKVFTVEGKISHLGNNNNDDDSHLKTFLDLFMISKAEKAYFGWHGEMYKYSAFAKTGALIGGIPFEILEF